MAAVTAGTVAYPATSKITDVVAGRVVNEVQCILIETSNEVDAGDTFTFDMATVGATTLLGVDGCKHTTDNSVIVTENPTTTVSSTTITFTVIAGSDDDKRIARIYVI